MPTIVHFSFLWRRRLVLLSLRLHRRACPCLNGLLLPAGAISSARNGIFLNIGDKNLLAERLQFLQDVVPLILREVELMLDLVNFIVDVVIKLLIESVLNRLWQILVEVVVRVLDATSHLMQLARAVRGHQGHVLRLLHILRGSCLRL